MSEIKLFENPSFGSVRFLPEGDSFWIVGADVLRALEYAESSITSPNKIFDLVPEEWKGQKPILTPGGTQQMLCLSEQGLYFFLGRSDKPKALPYQKWVAGEVIPSIRKTGEYIIEKAEISKDFSLTDLIRARKEILSVCFEGNQLALALDKTLVKLTGHSALQEAEAQLIAPQQQQLYTPTEIGKSIEPPVSAVQANKLLAAMGWQIKAGDKWEAVGDGVAHAVYVDTGKAHSSGTPIRQLKWTADVIFAVQAYVDSKRQIDSAMQAFVNSRG